MADKIDKVIVTNAAALKSKYGAAGWASVLAAVNGLIAADKAHGLQSRLVLLDDAKAMAAASAPVVASATDPQQNKQAIDAVYKAYAPDFILLLGAPDVVPHQDLANPLYSGADGDPDATAFGDLPYACEAAYSKDPNDFVGPTRVVGRLPDVMGSTDSGYLLGLLKTAAGYKPGAPQDFLKYFGISAAVWQASTSLSVGNVFGDTKNLQLVPTATASWSQAQLQSLAHFVNCHGADHSPQFFGQPADGSNRYPVALDAAYVDGKLREGTVMAAECCYGGQLYAASPGQPQIGLCNVYLANKAYGFFASTTIAYGPASGNGQADLLCQYFLSSVLAGASLGRASLEARQKFIQTSSPMHPADLKTLAQFNLYGDPSITPVNVPSTGAAPAAAKQVMGAGGVEATLTAAAGSREIRLGFDAARSERHDRRRALFKQGLHLVDTEPVPRRTRTVTGAGMLTALRNKATEGGLEAGKTISYAIRHAPQPKGLPRQLRAAAELPTAFHVMFTRRTATEKGVAAEDGKRQNWDLTLLVGKEMGGKLVTVEKICCR